MTRAQHHPSISIRPIASAWLLPICMRETECDFWLNLAITLIFMAYGPSNGLIPSHIKLRNGNKTCPKSNTLTNRFASAKWKVPRTRLYVIESDRTCINVTCVGRMSRHYWSAGAIKWRSVRSWVEIVKTCEIFLLNMSRSVSILIVTSSRSLESGASHSHNT